MIAIRIARGISRGEIGLESSDRLVARGVLLPSLSLGLDGSLQLRTARTPLTRDRALLDGIISQLPTARNGQYGGVWAEGGRAGWASARVASSTQLAQVVRV